MPRLVGRASSLTSCSLLPLFYWKLTMSFIVQVNSLVGLISKNSFWNILSLLEYVLAFIMVTTLCIDIVVDGIIFSDDNILSLATHHTPSSIGLWQSPNCFQFLLIKQMYCKIYINNKINADKQKNIFENKIFHRTKIKKTFIPVLF